MLGARPPRTSRLPVPLTSFIGREWEIATVSTRLRTPEVRLITLTGAGGIGKTRLALQIASTMHDIVPQGVWFVDLAPISDPALVLSTIAQTLGVREQRGVRIAETLCAALHEQHLLLLLDNFEQVVTAAPELALLLAEVPGMKLLVTSREALHLSGEHIVVVAPLAVPDPTVALAAEQLAQYAAVQLFVARAGGVRSLSLDRCECPRSRGNLRAPRRTSTGDRAGCGLGAVLPARGAAAAPRTAAAPADTWPA